MNSIKVPKKYGGGIRLGLYKRTVTRGYKKGFHTFGLYDPTLSGWLDDVELHPSVVLSDEPVCRGEFMVARACP
jgi:hypothetical protein